jgi:hypothetical protein
MSPPSPFCKDREEYKNHTQGTMVKFRAPKVPLFLLFCFYVNHTLSVINWWWFLSQEPTLFGDSLINAHISFCVIGSIIFVSCSSPFMFWAYRHCNQMPPNLRRNAIFLSIWIGFLVHDFPVWIMEFWIAWEFGLRSVLQGISLVCLSFSTFIGFFGLWLGYAWKVSGLLQKSISEAPSVALTHRGVQGALGDGPQI